MGALKNITFTAEPDLIERARQRAASERTTLNERFREWLAGYAFKKPTVSEVDRLLKSLSHVDAGRKFTREEMNARAARK
ncbi:MAG: hypothetical protein ABIR70_04520 [Bryobacteraceae bacterium]